MNDEIIISAKNLTKEYYISEGLFSFFKKDRVITALNGIDLEVHKGEIIGIIGRNGSGKSTLLKILSQITKPTYGKAIINGKIVSAIEVSGGFNPDLSGKENIKLIGQIWGMSSRKIKETENAIIEFANLSNLIFLPVKKLSTGMIGRLAASIIIHIEADIYIFDETLNGSDQLFTRKIHRKLINLQKNNKSILIASHKVTDLLSLCNKAILLEQGKIVQSGNPFETILGYQKILKSNIRNNTEITRNSLSNNYLEFKNISIANTLEGYNITFTLNTFAETISSLHIFTIINNSLDIPIGHTSLEISNLQKESTLSCNFPNNILNNGLYVISFVVLLNSENWLFFPKVMEFETKNNTADKYQFIPGILITEAKWEINN